jgi:mannosyltransferase OCH1-like enzyme
MRCQAAAFDTERRPKLPCVSLADSTTTPERSMFRSAIALRILALVALIYSLSIVRRHYVFQHYLRTRQITANNFPAPYIQVLNESVARNEQPPLDFDYATHFPDTKIPKKIHFIWFQNLYPTHDGSSQIPTHSSHAPELCRKYNPDYEIITWNATSSREFFAAEYSWFLPTYDGYRYPIQRIDALKYFVLYHFGGVYMDLDIACRRPLDPLLNFPAWFPEASPLGVNNDLMAAAPRHPILQRMTLELERHNKYWVFPYLTIFWSTGPQFSSDILKEWFEHYNQELLARTASTSQG